MFRVMQIGKALQDQRWLFESLMVQVEERRSAVENSAKQIHDRFVDVKQSSWLLTEAHGCLLSFLFWVFSRIHSVKIGHRKAENQIKMAKMIMMNELNKRANLLIEQLEVITSSFPSLLIAHPTQNQQVHVM